MKKTFKSDEEKYELVKLHWFEITEQLRGNKQEYLKYLKYSAGMYKQSYSDAVLVYHQNKNATKIADYKKWKRLGRYVKRGSHGVAVFGEIILAAICMTFHRQAVKNCRKCGHFRDATHLN